MGWHQRYLTLWHGGFNPEGIRIGGPGGKGTAVKVWDERQYQDLDDSVRLAPAILKWPCAAAQVCPRGLCRSIRSG